jgi:hypothetical protein
MKTYMVALLVILMVLIGAGACLAEGVNVIDLVKDNGVVAGIIIAAILFGFRYIPNEKIYGFVRGTFKKLGIAMTLGLSRYKWSSGIWNATIEPWFIDLIQNTVLAAIDGFVAGLQTDNV